MHRAQTSSLSLIGSGAPTTLSFQFGCGASRNVTLGGGNLSSSLANELLFANQF